MAARLSCPPTTPPSRRGNARLSPSIATASSRARCQTLRRRKSCMRKGAPLVARAVHHLSAHQITRTPLGVDFERILAVDFARTATVVGGLGAVRAAGGAVWRGTTKPPAKRTVSRCRRRPRTSRRHRRPVRRSRDRRLRRPAPRRPCSLRRRPPRRVRRSNLPETMRRVGDPEIAAKGGHEAGGKAGARRVPPALGAANRDPHGDERHPAQGCEGVRRRSQEVADARQGAESGPAPRREREQASTPVGRAAAVAAARTPQGTRGAPRGQRR